MTFNTFYKENKLVFIINIPLVEYHIFNIYSTNPFPTYRNDNLIFIQPSTKYVAIDNTQTYYIEINENQFDKCILMSHKNYICKQEQPSIIINNFENCELLLFTGVKAIPKSCDTRIIRYDQSLFIQLKSGNEWLFAIPKETSITLNCKYAQNLIKFKIQNSGKLLLDKTCKGHTKHYILNPHYSLTYKVDTDFVPNIDLNITCCDKIEILKTQNLTINEKYHILSVGNLQDASHKLN